MTTDPRLQELIEERAIADLLIRMCHLIDSFQLERLVDEVYAPDGSDDHGGGPVRGRAAIRAWYEDSTRNVAAAAHNLSNLRIAIDGERAVAHSNVVALIWTIANADGGPMREADYALSVRYVDRLSKRPEGWRVDARELLPNPSKTGQAYVLAAGELPATQRGIRSLSERDAGAPDQTVT
jgi:hypothetical protein